jgi:endogenous inhibitor of DNA gyrase (YacG/DUF329 family)
MDNEKQHTCPNCGKKFAVTEENKPLRPFCSKRCKMIDLGQWLGEKYVVGGEKAQKKSDEEER